MIYLLNIILISLFCAGLKQATEPGMLLCELREWWHKVNQVNVYEQPPAYYPVLVGTRSRWLFTITLGCVYCFASFWGTLLYWLLIIPVWGGEFCTANVIMWPLTCVSCVFVNGLFWNWLKAMEHEAHTP